MTDTVAKRSCRFGPLRIDYDDRVLTPRLWTLQQSRWAAEFAADAEPGPILELCAGVGQIGLAAAVLADRDLVQVEADPVAADYAAGNAARAGWAARVDIRVQRLETALAPDERFPLILADPPYLRSADIGRWPADPRTAIDGGVDGLDVVRGCLAVAARQLTDAGWLLLQVAGPRQDREVAELIGARHALVRRAVRVIDTERAIVLLCRRAIAR